MNKSILNGEIGIYPEISDPDFQKIINNKKEFYDNSIDNRYKDIYCLEPQQRFLSNFINPLTLYNSLLVYHSVGVGKTLTGVSIAENFKNDYKILVIVKNEILEFNFRKELTGICSNYFKNKEEAKIYNDPSHEDYVLVKNKINKEINKHYSFMTYGALVSNVIGRKKIKILNNTTQRDLKNVDIKTKKSDNTLLIIDEVHNVTGNDTYLAIITLLRNSKNIKVVLLSATPIYDNIKEIFEIANILGDNLPIRNELVKNKLIHEHQNKTTTLLKNSVDFLTPKGKDTIVKSLKGKVSYLIGDIKLFPERNYIGDPITNKQGSINIYKCNMSSFQQKVYDDTFINTDSSEITNKKNYNNLFMNSSNASTIVYPNKTYGKKGFNNNILKGYNNSFLKKENIQKYSCKLYHILVNIEKSQGLCFIFSDFVNFGGTALIKAVLSANGYSSYGSRNDKPKYITIDGSITPKKQQQLLRIFNNTNNKNGEIIKIIIGSPVVSEGITFKNIRQIHILEPYWNLSRIEQIIGRGARFKSHQALPQKDRKVDIFLYASMTSSSNNNSIDYLKYKLSEEKDRSIKEVEHFIKKIAIDCNLNKSRNTLKSTFNNSRDCQYNSCDYSCSSDNTNTTSIDNSTYSLTKHDKELYNFILAQIKKLYKIGFVYSLENIVKYVKNSTTLNINKKNIYYVLNDIINIPIEIENPLNKLSNLISVDNFYLLSPEENDIISEPFFNKIYIKNKEINNLNKVLNIKVSEKQKSKKKIVKFSPTILKELLFGSYIDKLGNNDKKFRIVDNRNIKNNDDIRNFATGKVCTFYSKSELKEISDYLKIKNSKILSKKNYCISIENFLKSKNKILK